MSRTLLIVTSIALLFSLARGNFALSSYVILVAYMTVLIAKIQLVKRKEIILALEQSLVEPLLIGTVILFCRILKPIFVLFGPEVDKQSVDGQLVTVFVMLQIVNLVCSKFDQIPKYLQTLGVKSQSFSNCLSLLIGGALLT